MGIFDWAITIFKKKFKVWKVPNKICCNLSLSLLSLLMYPLYMLRTHCEPDGNMMGTKKIQYEPGWFGFVDQFIHDLLCAIPCPICVPTFPESMHDGCSI